MQAHKGRRPTRGSLLVKSMRPFRAFTAWSVSLVILAFDSWTMHDASQTQFSPSFCSKSDSCAFAADVYMLGNRWRICTEFTPLNHPLLQVGLHSSNVMADCGQDLIHLKSQQDPPITPQEQKRKRPYLLDVRLDRKLSWDEYWGKQWKH